MSVPHHNHNVAGRIVQLRLSPLAWCGLVVFGIWTTGLIGFVASPGHFQVRLPRLQEAPDAGEHNLATAALGATVRASSFLSLWNTHHHPLFVLDQRPQPDLLEKWASAPGDTAPWIEVHWRAAHTLDRVIVRHAGAAEDPSTTIRRYDVTCLLGAAQLYPGPTITVDGNDKALADHQLPCAAARGVRLDLQPNSPGELVRIYEIEAWGR